MRKLKKETQFRCVKDLPNMLSCQMKVAYFLVLFQFLFISAFTQTIITGTIKDEKGEVLAGATVTVKNTNIGTATDSKGEFSVTAANNASLKISFTGFQSQEVQVKGRKNIDIVLQASAATLSDVVVVGYGSQKKIDLTGAVDQIDSKYLENKPVPNVSRALEGVIPNLNIKYSDGSPNTNPTYNIRGLTSIGAGGSALILIDGVVGDPSTLNPMILKLLRC